MNDELLPCPFCGYDKPFIDWNTVEWFVKCENDDCLIEGPRWPNKSGAISKWNERVVINENK